MLTWRPRAWTLEVMRRDCVEGALRRLPWSGSWFVLPGMTERAQEPWRGACVLQTMKTWKGSSDRHRKQRGVSKRIFVVVFTGTMMGML